MRGLIVAAGAVLSLAGCIAVPAYTEPAYPAYAPGYYYGPPATTFSFGYHRYEHRDGRRHGHRYGRGGRDRD